MKDSDTTTIQHDAHVRSYEENEKEWARRRAAIYLHNLRAASLRPRNPSWSLQSRHWW